MKSPSFALITGASQGLGRVFARALAARGQNVILVARSRDKLESLANELRSSRLMLVEVLEFDLASPSAGQRLARQIRDRKLPVNLLVNNAGFGVRGEFRNIALQRQMEMLSLNNAAIVELTYSLLPSLTEHAPAGIINVSSTAGFQPVPYASLYAATKSFLTSFSLGLQEELRSGSVSVVTLCPGRILAGGHSEEAKNGNRRFGFVYQSPEKVVKDASVSSVCKSRICTGLICLAESGRMFWRSNSNCDLFDFLCRSAFPKHQTLYERRNGGDSVTPLRRSCTSLLRQAGALLGKEH